MISSLFWYLSARAGFRKPTLLRGINELSKPARSRRPVPAPQQTFTSSYTVQSHTTITTTTQHVSWRRDQHG